MQILLDGSTCYFKILFQVLFPVRFRCNSSEQIDPKKFFSHKVEKLGKVN